MLSDLPQELLAAICDHVSRTSLLRIAADLIGYTPGFDIITADLQGFQENCLTRAISYPHNQA